MNNESRAFREILEASSTLAGVEIGRWKERGGSVVGYFCSAFPEEIITAAGLLP